MENFGLEALQKEMQSAKYILSLKDNWDEEGALGYRQETLEKVCELLKNAAIALEKNSTLGLKIPKICHSEEGSIDLYWEKSLGDKHLLINIPSDRKLCSTYYGENYSTKEELKGETNSKFLLEQLMLWISVEDV